MKAGLERRWTALLDSGLWRRFTGTTAVRSALRSRPARAADLARRRRAMGRRAAESPEMFSSVRTFCLVVGHTKSGGSMLGAMLDAHPRIVMADELDVLKYMAAGFDAGRLYHLIDKSARREALKGRVTARRLSPYSFEVPGQWQGRHDSVEVVGDSKAGIATQRLGDDPGALADLGHLIGPASLKVVHVVRNPFDPIAVMMIRGGRSIDGAIDRYFANCDILADLHSRLDAGTIEIVQYENMVAESRTVLTNVCRFLGVDCTDEYIEACVSVVRPEPERERTRVDWTGPVVADIEARAQRYPFLSGYRFDS
jgi:hypothetical protein